MVVFVVYVAMQLSFYCPVTYLGMHVVPRRSTIHCPQIAMANGVVDDMHRPADVAYFDKEGDTSGAGHSRKSSRRASTVDQPIDDYNDEGYDEDFGMMSDGDVSVHSSSEESEDESKDKEIPDGIILDLYQEMQELRSIGLDRFSVEEEVHIVELLHLLKELNAPLKAFSGILNWAAKANSQGHIIHPECQPSRRRVIHTLYCRYNMNGLIPKEKLFYLPYSRRIVPMIYFDAREVSGKCSHPYSRAPC